MAKAKLVAKIMSRTGEQAEVTTAFIVERLEKSVKWLYKAVVAIYNGQTQDEKVAKTTSHDNGIGFNGVDAEILSSFAEQIKARGFLTPKQIEIARKKMRKYAGQLARIAVENRCHNTIEA